MELTTEQLTDLYFMTIESCYDLNSKYTTGTEQIYIKGIDVIMHSYDGYYGRLCYFCFDRNKSLKSLKRFINKLEKQKTTFNSINDIESYLEEYLKDLCSEEVEFLIEYSE